MPQNLKDYISKEYLFKIAGVAATGTYTVGYPVGNAATAAGSTVTGVLKAVKGTGASTVYLVDSIAGTTIFADTDTLYFLSADGTSSTGSSAIDDVVGADGSDFALTARGIERVTKVGGRVISEVLVALKHFTHRFAALVDFDTPATISGAVVSGSAGNVVDISAGNTILLTITGTEPLLCYTNATVALTTATGTNNRVFTYLSGAGSGSLVFSYTPVAGDIGIAGTVGGIGTMVTGGILETSVQDGKAYTKEIGGVIPAASGASAISIVA
jgi:hypothetical protein